MALYGVAYIDSKEKDPRDRFFLKLYSTPAGQQEELNASLKRAGIKRKTYDRAMESGGDTLSLARQGGRYLYSFTCELGSVPNGSRLKKGPPPALDTMEAQMVYILRKRALETQGVYHKRVLRCMASLIENYSRYGEEDPVGTVLEMTDYLSKKHSSQPFRKAFQAGRTTLSRCVRQYEKGVRLEGDPMYGKGGKRY